MRYIMAFVNSKALKLLLLTSYYLKSYPIFQVNVYIGHNNQHKKII